MPELTMQIHEEIQQHLIKLDLHLQSEVLDFVLFWEQKQQQSLPDTTINEEGVLKIHQQLMDQYADTFYKLAQ